MTEIQYVSSRYNRPIVLILLRQCMPSSHSAPACSAQHVSMPSRSHRPPSTSTGLRQIRPPWNVNFVLDAADPTQSRYLGAERG
jgi:hypothetical protein